jgi:hypothetical protein
VVAPRSIAYFVKTKKEHGVVKIPAR